MIDFQKLQQIAALESQSSRKESISQFSSKMLQQQQKITANSVNFMMLVQQYLDFSFDIRDHLISQEFIFGFTKKLVADNNVQIDLIKSALIELISRLKTKESLHSESNSLAGRKLIDIYKTENDWLSASQIMESTPNAVIKSANGRTAEQEKMEIYIKAGEALRLQNGVSKAESLLGKAGQFLKIVGEQHQLFFDFKLLQANIFDSKRLYDKAYPIYIELILNRYGTIEIRLNLLTLCTKNIILSEPCTQRFNTLLRVVRTKASVKTPLFTIARKIANNQTVIFDSIDTEKYGYPVSAIHSLLNTSAGTDPRKAPINGQNLIKELNQLFCKHNIYCLSKIFSNISFEILSKLTHLDIEFLEDTLIQMANSNSLKLYIDRVSDIVIFGDDNNSYIKDFTPSASQTSGNSAEKTEQSVETLQNFDSGFGSGFGFNDSDLSFNENIGGVETDEAADQLFQGNKPVFVSDLVHAVDTTSQLILNQRPETSSKDGTN